MSSQPAGPPPPPSAHTFAVDLPIGGKIHLQSAEEVLLWQKAAKRYIDDYHLSNINDLNLLGAILQQLITQFRATMALNGMVPLLDANNVPTGQYSQQKLDADETGKYTKILNVATGEIRALEKTLGIDKVSREAGGQVSVANYLRELKAAAHERALHISKRTLWVEGFINELSTMLRMLRNLDEEDKRYHGLTDEKVLDWCTEKVDEFVQIDKKYHRERGKLYVGRL